MSQEENNEADVKQGLLTAYRRLLGPLVRILIRNGISYNELAEELKGVFVEIAHKDFPIDGRSPSGTRIAILTGLTRKEVKKQLEKQEGLPVENTSDPNRVMRVLNGWHNDPEFIGPYGIPHELVFDSKSARDKSFSELVKRYSGDMSPRAMLDELLRTGAVEQLGDGALRVLTRSHVTSKLDPAMMTRLGTIIGNLAETLDHNFQQQDSRKTRKRFERNVWTEVGLNQNSMTDFSQLVNDKGQMLIETLDHFLTANEGIDLDDNNKADIKAGVEIYLYVEKDD